MLSDFKASEYYNLLRTPNKKIREEVPFITITAEEVHSISRCSHCNFFVTLLYIQIV